jgi:threonine synthase
MKLGPVTHTRCTHCGHHDVAGVDFQYLCASTGGECGWLGNLDLEYDYAAGRAHFLQLADMARPRGIERYLPLLPILSAASLPPVQVGGTPLTPAPRLAARFGLRELLLKEDNRNPSGSFKDRASAVAIAVAREQGHRLMTTASTGNAASSLAALAASVGMKTVIFVPERAPEAKVAQLLIHGAQVMLVEGTYDDAFELSLEATRRFGWFNRNTGFNPVCLEGKKTVSFEIWEDLDRHVPEAVLVSVGDGCIIAGIGKGFLDLQRMGLIKRVPRLYGIQAEGSNVLTKAYRSGRLCPEAGSGTYADSICVGQPRAATAALLRVRESGGAFLSVNDDAIREAQVLMARESGVFAEPAAAAALAGLGPAIEQGMILPSERVVIVVTGSGLKDIRGAMTADTGQPCLIPADLNRLEEFVRSHLEVF